MFSASLMGAGMGGMLDQTTAVDEQKILDNYEMAPRTMLMGMPMLGVMYAPSDWITLMAMVPGMGMTMNHVGHEAHLHTLQTASANLPGTNMQSLGLGDISVSALLGNWTWQAHSLHANLGLSLPTGAIDILGPVMGTMPAEPLPYSMRLGSGTWDLLPGFTYSGKLENWCWGLQPSGVLRLSTNSLNYRLGNRLSTNAWLSYRWNDLLSSSLRFQGQIWGNAEGEDSRISKNAIPSADPLKLGGQRLDLFLGLNFTPFPRQRLGLEIGMPVYQNLSGPQMAQVWSGIAGWQISF